MQRPDLAQALFLKSDTALETLPSHTQLFCVGGAVRDMLLGNPSADRDYVVVGATVDQMLNAGFTPVGKDFPVFLHPSTHDEYALARTERKSGKGYKGFVFMADPNVTLEQDLMRRDLTINAIAIDSNGNIIDPCHGIQDLSSKTLRHVSDAFSEDPVRLLRLARFSARWPDFQIAAQTEHLCKKIVADGEAQALVPERVWQELQTGLMERKPSRMIELLIRIGAWQAIVSGDRVVHARTLERLDEAAAQGFSLEQRFGLLVHNLDSTPIDPSCFKAPKACLEFAQLLQTLSLTLPKDFDCASTLLEWIFSADFQRKPARFRALLKCLTLEGQLGQSALELLDEIQALFTKPDAVQVIANAAQSAEKNGVSAKEAVHNARLALLRTHPRFS